MMTMMLLLLVVLGQLRSNYCWSVTAWVVPPMSVVVTTVTPVHRRTGSRIGNSRNLAVSRQQQPPPPLTMAVSSILPTIPNPLQQLPWNIQKEHKRKVRRNKIERSKLYRELGIAEDATYEEIVVATEKLLELAGADMKQTIRIEIIKDQILQHRLKERLDSLLLRSSSSSSPLDAEARAMSNYEMDGYVQFVGVSAVLLLLSISLCMAEWFSHVLNFPISFLHHTYFLLL
jgi:hypothetical protein